MPCALLRTSTAMSPAASGRSFGAWPSATSPRCAAASRRAISVAVAATTATVASRWNIGSPSSAGGSVQTCSGADGAGGALVSTSGWRGFLPNCTSW